MYNQDDKTERSEKFPKMGDKKQKNSKRSKSARSNKGKKSSSNSKESTGRGLSTSSSYGGNDISWYTRNPALTESAARIPYANFPGKKTTIQVPRWKNGEDSTEGFIRYPGILAMTFALTVGVAGEVTDPINVAAREIYGKIRACYSSSLEADAPDIMMYILAIDSILMLIEDMKRAYYVINLYSPYNTMYPKAMINALGYNFDDLLANKTRMYQNITELVAQVSKFAVPDVMDLFKRHQFMCANIYCDSPTVKAQNYVFVPDQFYELVNAETMTELSSETWTSPVTTSKGGKTVQNSYNRVKEALDALMNWDTAYTILGYLQRAYKDTPFIAPAYPIEGATLVPVYNYEVLTQINNATIVPINTATLDVKQDPTYSNVLISKPAAAPNNGSSIPPKDVFVTLTNSDTPTAMDNIIATRLTVSSGSADNLLTCGTEILTSMSIYWDTDPREALITLDGTNFWIGNQATTNRENALNRYYEIVRSIGCLSAFDYHPTLFLYSDDADTGELEDVIVIGDMDNTTVISNATLANLHRVCVYSEFNCFGNN